MGVAMEQPRQSDLSEQLKRNENNLHLVGPIQHPGPMPALVHPKLSYAYGRSKRELIYVTLNELIESAVSSKPNEIALTIHELDLHKTYKELNEDINQLVNMMHLELGLERGQSIGLYSYNSYECLLVYYAANKLGLVLNPLNPNYKTHELSWVLKKSNVRCLFMPGAQSEQRTLNDHWVQLFNEDIAKLQRDGLISNLKSVVFMDGSPEVNRASLASFKLDDKFIGQLKTVTWSEHVSRNSKTLDHELVRAQVDSVSSDDLYCVYYTSGTTGEPKGVTISQFTAINSINLFTGNTFKYRANHMKPFEPIVCIPLPLFHAFAGVVGALLPFVEGGGRYVMTGMKYKVATVFETIHKHRCNVLYATSTIMIDLLKYHEQNQRDQLVQSSCSNLRVVCTSSLKIAPETVKKSCMMLPNLEDFQIFYGSSENGVIATMQNGNDDPEAKHKTIGTPLDLTEVRIACPQTGQRTLPIGQLGEVQTRGFNLMSGYLNDPKRTQEVVLPSRWYRTGDLATMDSHGSVYLVGRLKELIIKGGENIYPAEVESVLQLNEHVDVAHVFGLPNPRFGEEVAVWVRPKPGHFNEDQMRADIVNWCKSKLSYFKVPKHIIFTQEFPMTGVNKIKKFEMRAQTLAMLGMGPDGVSA